MEFLWPVFISQCTSKRTGNGWLLRCCITYMTYAHFCKVYQQQVKISLKATQHKQSSCLKTFKDTQIRQLDKKIDSTYICAPNLTLRWSYEIFSLALHNYRTQGKQLHNNKH